MDNKLIMSEGGGFYAWLDGVMGVVYYTYFRPLMKWFLRATTRLCELQRVCYGQTPGAQRTISVGEITTCSRALQVHTKLLFFAFRGKVSMYLSELNRIE